MAWPLMRFSHSLGRAEDRLDLMEKGKKDQLVYILANGTRCPNIVQYTSGESPLLQGLRCMVGSREIIHLKQAISRALRFQIGDQGKLQ